MEDEGGRMKVWRWKVNDRERGLKAFQPSAFILPPSSFHLHL
jgi:hypothetical protein